MKCPTCSLPLSRTDYENVPVFQCPQCQGYLVSRNRMLLIKSARLQSSEALQAEAAAGGGADGTEAIRCPKCREQRMQKERVPVRNGEGFSLDVCRKCRVVWFDGGELARVQMHHEQSAKALEAYAFQQEARERTEEEAAELERNIAALPASATWLEGAFGEKLLFAAAAGMLVASFICLGLELPTALAVVTNVAGTCTALFCFRRLGTIVERWIALGLIVVVEVLFFGYLWGWF